MHESSNHIHTTQSEADPFIFVLLPGWLLVFYGYYNRDAIDPDIIKKYASESLDLGRSAKIGIACAIAGPPTIRYILSLFGWEL